MRYDESVNRVYKTKEDFIYQGIQTYANEAYWEAAWEKLPEVKIGYDSEADTLKHIKRVSSLLSDAAIEFLKRGQVHDTSKTLAPEKEEFDRLTPLLAGSTYGSDGYKELLAELKPALDNHYANNSHHPEHYPQGIDGMNLFDLVEMFFDWKAATERHDNGDIFKSIEINEKRFNIAPQISSIFRNTANKLGWGK